MQTRIVGIPVFLQTNAIAKYVSIKKNVQEVEIVTTAANFENDMKKILLSKMTDAEKDKAAKELVKKVLKEIGYDAGVEVWEKLLRITHER